MRNRAIDPAWLRRFEEDGVLCLWHVYGLKDPRNGVIRYVGITFDPEQRLRNHLADRSNTPKSAWIRQLRTCGFVPDLVILESGDGGRSTPAVRLKH
jgi:hypothetical protein